MRAACRSIFLFLILIASFSVSASYAASSNDVLASAIDKTIEKAIQEKRITGAVVMIARRGQIIYENAAGLADREASLPMSKDTIFRLSSLTKAFTTYAAAVQIQKGIINLEDPVTKWLPDFKPALPDGRQPVITIRHLLSHTAGLDYGFSQKGDSPYLRAEVSDGLDSSGISLDENLRRIARVPLLFAPGSNWRYSLSMDVLGAVIAKAHGTSFDKAMMDLVVEPLKLREAGFLVSDTSRLASVYYFDGENLQRARQEEFLSVGEGTLHISLNRARDHQAYPSGGAGMLATAPEVLTLLEAIRTASPPLGETLLREFCANQIGKNRIAPGVGFGLGWAVLLDPTAASSPQSPGTISWSGVYGHTWFIDPVQGLSAVVMTTTVFEGLGGTSLMGDIQKALYAYLKR